MNCVECGEEKPLPEWVPISPADSTIRGEDKRVYLMDADQIVSELNSSNLAIALDVAHSTELKAPKGENYFIAAWLKPFRVNPQTNNIEGKATWISLYEPRVRSGELKYISPAYKVAPSSRKVLRISSAGFVPHPNFEQLSLNHHQLKMNDEQIQELKTELNLSEDASGADIVSAAKALNTKCETALNSVQDVDVTKYVPRTDYEAKLTELKNAQIELNSIRDEAAQTELNAAIDQYRKDGKIPPAQVEQYKKQFKGVNGLTELNAFMSNAPALVPAEERAPSGQPESSSTELNAEAQALATMFGNSIEDLKTFGK